MKLNPKISDFIKNRIENTKLNRYIHFEETDLENVEKLILETATNEKLKYQLLHQANEEINGKPLIEYLPYTVISEIFNSLTYRKQASGCKKVREVRDKYFPNWDEIHNAHCIGKRIKQFNHLNFVLEEDYQSHFEVEK